MGVFSAPTTLPCGHSVCKTCLSDLALSVCPVCFEAAVIPERSRPAATNVLLGGIVEVATF